MVCYPPKLGREQEALLCLTNSFSTRIRCLAAKSHVGCWRRSGSGVAWRNDRAEGPKYRIGIQRGWHVNVEFRLHQFRPQPAAPVSFRELSTSERHPKNLVARDHDLYAIPLADEEHVTVGKN